MNTGCTDNYVPSDLKIFGSKRDEVAGEWRKLHYEKLYDPYCSANIIWLSKTSEVRRAGNLARMGGQ
jgi:hypothetical protein